MLSTTRGWTALAAVIAATTSWGCADTPTQPVNTTAAHLSAVKADAALTTTGWQAESRALVAANRLSPNAAARVYALLSVGQYQAVVDVGDNRDRSEDNGNDDLAPGPSRRPSRDVERGAVAGASWRILSFFFPSADAVLEQRVLEEAGSSTGQTRAQFTRGVAAGIEAANILIEQARNDHFSDPWTGTVPTGPGMWRNNGPPFAPMLGAMTPYFLSSGDQFRPSPPPVFGSEAFLADLDEVSRFSATRTAEQLAIAQYWNFPGGTVTPPGYWNEVASQYVGEAGLNEYASARVLALTHAAMMDAMIGCWDAKYFYWYIRPSQVNSAITLPLGLPNHPSYPSGHSCVSSAATTVLSHFFPARSAQLAAWLVEAGMSRIYAGIHYRFDITAGEALGTAVAREGIRIDAESGLLSALR